ncbi:ABC transporter [Aureococcus anophagefferens]|uniref:ABC transporter n=1 Tax=Aureococcus anophagefferens TaxID=44056 RepID=A0ABR1GDX7_AURAN
MYSLYLGFASSGLSSSFAEFQRASARRRLRLLALSDRESLMPPSSGAMPDGAGPHAVEFKNVTFSYPTRRDAAPALDGFDLRVAPGARAAKGASGCGKSTLLRLISRLYDVDGGRVTVGGVDVRDLDASFARTRAAKQRRVAIARLFLNDPPVVLLDEFSSALDERTMLEVAANLSDALAGKTSPPPRTTTKCSRPSAWTASWT